MKRILVKQTGRTCQVWHGDELVLESGRVACKGYALGLHIKTGDPYFNVKSTGKEVEIRAKISTHNGLLLRGGVVLLTPEADRVAQEYGHANAGMMVKHLEGRAS